MAANSVFLKGWFSGRVNAIFTHGWLRPTPTPTGDAANHLVTHGLGGLLMVTDGLGAAPKSTGNDENIIRLSEGGLKINVHRFNGSAFVFFSDGVNQRFVHLKSATAGQVSGSEYMVITGARKSDGRFYVFLDGVEQGSFPVTTQNYGGNLSVMGDGKAGDVFDVRLKEGSVSNEAVKYFNDTLKNYGGDSFLPNAEPESSVPGSSGGASPETVSISGPADIAFDGGGLKISIEKVGPDAVLTVFDGATTRTMTLPFTAGQLSGSEYANIKLVRSGTSLHVTIDKTYVGSITGFPLTIYGNNLYLGKEKASDLFDVRVIPGQINKATSDYYLDTLQSNGGDTILPVE